jgi:hypothetical protein
MYCLPEWSNYQTSVTYPISIASRNRYASESRCLRDRSRTLYRLYKLLFEAPRLYINQNAGILPSNRGMTGMAAVDHWTAFDFASFGAEASGGGATA